MKIRCFTKTPPPEMARALIRFERQFRYPLGPGQFFTIAHGEDYPRFYRAMGEGASFVAERDGNILGAIGAARRRLALPGGGVKDIVYIGDAKVSPQKRGGRVLWRLIESVRHWAVQRAEAAYSVVMEGTPVPPTCYTGRLGVELFEKLAKIMILKIPTGKVSGAVLNDWECSAADGWNGYWALTQNAARCLGGKPAVRSAICPQWLAAPNREAVGLIEDTRRGKRLLLAPPRGSSCAGEGVEINASHLSHCAWSEAESGIALLRQALLRLKERGFGAMFAAVPLSEAETIAAGLGLEAIVRAPAGIYGAGLDSGMLWNINTSEI